MTDTVPFFDEEQIRRRLSPREAVRAISAALRAGLDPGADPARMTIPTAHGQLLIMPATGADHAGVKVVTVAPANTTRGLPRIQGLYLLFDATTLTPAALLDGAALTAVRTPAVSVAAVLPWLTGDTDPLRIAVFGTGPQGRGHVDTLTAILTGHRSPDRVTYLTRRPGSVQIPDHGTIPVTLAEAGTTDADEALTHADVVVCATTARTPLFDSTLLSNHAIVLAVGSHEPDAREVDGALLARAHVIVEDVATALREGGDVVLAVAERHLTPADLIPLGRAVTDPVSIRLDRPIVFKSTGMAWEDLVIATAIVQHS
jgi:ornithine cyclodeaminase/alanine dehydrogenase-like protein (mu-crystallin family)